MAVIAHVRKGSNTRVRSGRNSARVRYGRQSSCASWVQSSCAQRHVA